jgi:SAM-dependent methyltransferase
MYPLPARMDARSTNLQARYWVHGTAYRPADHPVTKAYAEPKCRLIDRYTGLPEGAMVLDVGTGNGTLHHCLSKRYRCQGIDSSAHLLSQHCDPGHVALADAGRLPLADRSVDMAVESCVLHHVPDPALLVSEMARVARKAICLIEPNVLNPPSLLFHALVPEERGALSLTRGRLRRTIGASFEVVFARAVGLVFPNKTPAWMLPLLRPFDRPWPLGNVNVVIALRRE